MSELTDLLNNEAIHQTEHASYLLAVLLVRARDRIAELEMNQGSNVSPVAVRWECPCGFSTTKPWPDYDAADVEAELLPHIIHTFRITDWVATKSARDGNVREGG